MMIATVLWFAVFRTSLFSSIKILFSSNWLTEMIPLSLEIMGLEAFEAILFFHLSAFRKAPKHSIIHILLVSRLDRSDISNQLNLTKLQLLPDCQLQSVATKSAFVFKESKGAREKCR